MSQNTSHAVMAQRHELAEEWRPIQGWPGYEVSSLGRVRSFKWASRRRRGWEINIDRGSRLLKPCVRNGYPSVLLCDVERGRSWKSVHVLVLEAFVGPRPEGKQGAHGDGDRERNHLSNLRWASPSENNADKLKHGTHQCGEAIGTAKLTRRTVASIRSARDAGARVRHLAKKYGVCRNTITNITTGRTWRRG